MKICDQMIGIEPKFNLTKGVLVFEIFLIFFRILKKHFHSFFVAAVDTGRNPLLENASIKMSTFTTKL
jgi:hypothetical protein